MAWAVLSWLSCLFVAELSLGAPVGLSRHDRARLSWRNCPGVSMHLFRSARYPGSRKMTVSEPTTAQIVSIRRKTHLRYQKNDFRVSRMRFLALGYFTSLQSLLTLFHFQYRVPAASSAESGDMTGSGKKELHTDNRCAVLFFAGLQGFEP